MERCHWDGGEELVRWCIVHGKERTWSLRTWRTPCLSAVSTPWAWKERRSQEECQDARHQQHLKMLKFTWLHGNGSTLLNFTQFHLRCSSLGFTVHFNIKNKNCLSHGFLLKKSCENWISLSKPLTFHTYSKVTSLYPTSIIYPCPYPLQYPPYHLFMHFQSLSKKWFLYPPPTWILGPQ